MEELKLKGHTVYVHNHGYVRLVDWMGTDIDIVEAARVSYKSGSKGEADDKRLLGYLLKNKHTSPFEMCKVKFNIKMPIFVQRQFIRHRMQNFNEVSARYTELKDDFFLPAKWRTNEGVKNKQASVEANLVLKESHQIEDVDGSTYQTKDVSQVVGDYYRWTYILYKELLAAGVAREQARMILPVGIYTEFYCCWDLNNLLKYFALRDDPHAQGEHQDYAKAMKDLTAKLFPWTMEIYEDTRRSSA